MQLTSRLRGIAVPAGLAFAVVTLFVPATVSASVIGQVGTLGPGVIAFTSGGANFIDWCPPNAGSPGIGQPGCGATTNNGLGTFMASGGTNSFSAATAGTIKDSTNGPATATYVSFPIGVPVSIDNYLTINSLPAADFRATMFENVSCATTATQFCINGFELSQNGANTSVTITLDGVVIPGDGTANSNWSYVISGQYIGMSISQVVSGAASPTGVYSNTWSGTLTASAAPIPEPGTIGLMGFSLIGLSFLLSRRVRKTTR